MSPSRRAQESHQALSQILFASNEECRKRMGTDKGRIEVKDNLGFFTQI